MEVCTRAHGPLVLEYAWFTQLLQTIVFLRWVNPYWLKSLLKSEDTADRQVYQQNHEFVAVNLYVLLSSFADKT